MNITKDIIRLSIFVLVGVLILGLLYMTLGRTRLTSTEGYSVMFANSSGLESGDLVRIAGVRVGQVGDVEMQDGNVVKVDFTVDEDQVLTDETRVLVRFENLLGDRYLELSQAPDEGAALEPGDVIPVEQATPALDLDLLLNGFRPLFRGLEPGQVNELADNLIATLQGRGGTVEALLEQTGALTNGLADDDEAIGSLITNMNLLLDSLDSRDTQLRTAIRQLRVLVQGLAKDRNPIVSSVVSIDQLTARLTDLFRDTREPFKSTVIAVNELAKLLNTNTDTLNKVLNQLPAAHQTLDRIGSHGSFFNFYLCRVQVMISGPNGQPIKTPVVRSQTERCS